MLERSMFEDPEIRAAVAAENMAIVWVSPGAWPGKLDAPEQPSLAFTPKDDAIAGVQRLLTALASESGYTEIQLAPLLVTGHSAASPFVWGMAAAEPNRVFAALPYKGYTVGLVPEGVPILYVSQEWAEWGKTWGEVWHKELATIAAMRREHPSALLGDFVDLGSGHFDWHAPAAPVIAMFIRKAAEERLPANTLLNGPAALRPVPADAGVLVDPATLGTAQFRAIPASRGRGDTGNTLWYFDDEMATAVDRSMRENLAKRPQAIDFVAQGKPAPLVENGFAVLRPEFLADGITFRVHAASLSASPSAALYPGKELGHATAPIQFRVSSGALAQVGPDTFQVAAHSGGLTRQGQPWEPWIMAYQPGDAEYRSADRPAHILIDIRNIKGTPQTIAFERIRNISRKTREIKLSAKATSNLPVQFFVESGPATVEGDTLHILPAPPRSRYPMRVIVSAFQWGRTGDQAIQTAGPVTQMFFVN